MLLKMIKKIVTVITHAKKRAFILKENTTLFINKTFISLCFNNSANNIISVY